MGYEPTDWKKGDKISVGKLNKLEKAVKEVSDKSVEIDELRGTVEALRKEITKLNKAKG